MNYEKLIEDNSRLIWKIANYFYGIPKEDLYQAGVVGLLKALKNYKKDSNAKFSSYAHDYIYGEMFLLASNKDIKISKDILRLYKKIECLRYELAQKLGKIPSNLELSEYSGISFHNIELALLSGSSIMQIDSIDDEDKKVGRIIQEESEDVDTKILLDDCMGVLTGDEKNIIKSRYYEDLTQSEVAKKLNMTQVMVSRYEKRSLEKMYNYLSS